MKILTEETCPHCKKGFESEKELENLEAVRSRGTIKEIVSQAQLLQDPIKQAEPPKVEVKVKTVAPSDEPYYHCEGDNCMGLHKNPNYKVRPNKKCVNCSTLNSPKAKGCKNCKKDEFDELSDEDLDDLEIPKPEIHDHSHEDD